QHLKTVTYTANNLTDGCGRFALAISVIKLDTTFLHNKHSLLKSRQERPHLKLCAAFVPFLLIDSFDLVDIRANLRCFLLTNQSNDQITFSYRIVWNILNQGKAFDFTGAANMIARGCTCIDNVTNVDVFIIVEGNRNILFDDRIDLIFNRTERNDRFFLETQYKAMFYIRMLICFRPSMREEVTGDILRRMDHLA